MQPIEGFIVNIEASKIKLWTDGNKLKYEAPKGTITPEILQALRDRKQESIDYLISRDTCNTYVTPTGELSGVKKLPVTVPAIIGLHYHAYPLSVILQHEQCLPWFYSHFIQIYCITDFTEVIGSPWFNFVSYELWDNGIPFLSHSHLLDKKAILSNKINVVDLVKSYLDRDWYTYVAVDDFFIPFREAYQKFRLPHDLFIYGYDLQNKCFDAAGFNYNHVYSFDQLNFDDFEKAFFNCESSMVNVDIGRGEFIRFFKVLEYMEYEFDVKLVVELLNDYLNSIDTTEKLRLYKSPIKGRAYGMATYSYFNKYYQLLLEDKVEFDIRPLHMLWEHKKCMLSRINYMYENGILSKENSIGNDYGEVEQKTLAARNFMVKYFVSKDKELIHRIISNLAEIEKKERVVLTSLLDEIERKC